MEFFKQDNNELNNKSYSLIQNNINYLIEETKNLSTLYLNHKINNIENIIIYKTINNVSKTIISIYNLFANSNIYEYTKILKYSFNKIRKFFNKIIILISHNFNQEFFYIINQTYFISKINSKNFIKYYKIIIHDFDNVNFISKTFNKFYNTINKFKKIIDFIFFKYFNSNNSSNIFI